jgi:hypothetical protein
MFMEKINCKLFQLKKKGKRIKARFLIFMTESHLLYSRYKFHLDAVLGSENNIYH